MPKQELSPQTSPEARIQLLVDALTIREEIRYEFYERGPWYKQYGNTMDPDGEYRIAVVEESVSSANEAKHSLWELGKQKPEFLGSMLASLVRKQIPADEPHYVISTTETGFQCVSPEPSTEQGLVWTSASETRKMIDETVLGFGLQAVPYLESMKSGRARGLIGKLKMQELKRKIKNIFSASFQQGVI